GRGSVAQAAAGDEVVADVVGDGVGQRCGFAVVAGGAEAVEGGDGRVLVGVADFRRHVDEVDRDGVVQGVEHGRGQLDPGVGVAGADVEQAVGGGGFGR